jgi:transcription antitermination factor NusG
MPILPDMDDKKWFALYTKPRHEFKAKIQLDNLLIENYLPTLVQTRQWHDRKKKIIEPLFKGYIFICVDEKERITALQQSAIVKTVGFSGKPSVIPEWQIKNLKIVLAENPDIFVTDKIELGSNIVITDGPFSGVVGTVKEINNEKWLSVSVELLQRSVSVRIPTESVDKYEKS